ncbi:zinc-binding dehydrogenase [uncultured Tessaracoccus sp.]|uniref:zinc-dependent alcohol dehydrogenase n=1 Tax=uncultured Tessaracoccus sp. TaxID=905023 RepID=UPI002604D8D1|nr:zinc-binding dehydrogenase [uncultured Tessaracoccus sp.]
MSRTMQSLVVQPDGTLELWDVDVPKPQPWQALVQIISGGVCGTDNTLVHQCFKGVDPDQYPLVIGHESVGRVVEVGDQVVSYQVGDVVMLPVVGEPVANDQVLGSAWGAFSEYGLVDDAAVPGAAEVAPAQSIVPADIDPVLAPVMVTLREVLSSIQVSGLPLDAPLCVYGSGPVAMTFTKLLKLLGAEDVTVVVRSQAKAELMSSFGADRCIDTSVEDLAEAIRTATPDGLGGVVDAVGKPEIINEALGLIRDRGVVFAYGVPKSNAMQLDWSAAPYNWTLKFQQMPRKDEEGACHEQVIQWIREGRLQLEDFVSAVVPIADAPTYLQQQYLTGGTQKKIIFKFEH